MGNTGERKLSYRVKTFCGQIKGSYSVSICSKCNNGKIRYSTSKITKYLFFRSQYSPQTDGAIN